MKELIHYFDYKSPYAYLAQAATDALEARGVVVIRLPYTLDIPQYLGAAELDASGRDVIGTRNAHQWRRVRYSYMDCRREANRRGLIIRGTRKIWDSRLAHIGFLYAAEHRRFAPYHATVFARFWRREIDIEAEAVITGLLREAGIDTAGFGEYANRRGALELARIQREAEAAGVFGVPSWRLDGELFWGAERLPLLEERLRLPAP